MPHNGVLAQHSSSTYILHSSCSLKTQVILFVLIRNSFGQRVLKLFVLMSYVIDAFLAWKQAPVPLNQLDSTSVSQKRTTKKKKTQESSPDSVLNVPSAAADSTDEDWEIATNIAISSLKEDNFDIR